MAETIAAERKGRVVPLAPRMQQWVRGPARLEDDQVVFDYTRAEKYFPDEFSNLPLALARTRTPGEVVKFVQQFGMLNAGPQYFDDEYWDGIPRDTAPTEAREPFTAFLDEANKIRQVVTIRRLLKRAIKERDPSAISKLRTCEVLATPGEEIREILGEDSWQELRQQHKEFLRTDEALFMHVGGWLSMVLTEALAKTRLVVQAGGSSRMVLTQAHGKKRRVVWAGGSSHPDDRPGTIRLESTGESLREFCYLHLVQVLAEKVVMADCQECEGPFVVKDGRQKFCTKTCATRQRVRHHRQKPAERKPGGKHGKATRTRRG